MKFFIRFAKLPDSYSIINAQHLPKAIEYCKQYRPDCIVSKMDDKTITPNIFIKLKKEVNLELIGIKHCYELMYDNNGEKDFVGIECLPKDLESETNKAFNSNAKLFTIDGVTILVKTGKKNKPICIVKDMGPKKDLILLK